MLCPAACSPWISDAILDALLAQDSTSRVAVETLVTTGLVHVAGEVTTKAYAPIPALVREANLDIGCDSSATGFDGASCGVSVSIGAQSPDIAQGWTPRTRSGSRAMRASSTSRVRATRA